MHRLDIQTPLLAESPVIILPDPGLEQRGDLIGNLDVGHAVLPGLEMLLVLIHLRQKYQNNNVDNM
ncbi:hypothetical protein D3C81_1679200 [compost metagenome]